MAFMSERDVGKYIQTKIQDAKKKGMTELTLISGDVQAELFLKDKEGLPEICTAMQNLMEEGDEILKRPKSRVSAGLVIRYKL